MKLDLNECKEKVVSYIFEKKDRTGGITSHRYVGIPGKKGYLYESSDKFGNFNDKLTKIPLGAKKISKNNKKIIFNDEYIEEFVCKKKKLVEDKNKLKKQLGNALDFSDKWYDKSRQYWLTIEDIIKMKKDDKIILLSLHRNALDIPMSKFTENTAYDPKTFFKSEKITYTHDTEMKGKILEYDNHILDNTIFHVEYKKNLWYPFDKNGYLPAHDEQKLFKLLDKKKHWTKFSINTHIGFRGPVIKWNDLDKLPKIAIISDDYK